MKTLSANRQLPLFLFLCIGVFTTKAQYVAIPDSNFGKFLNVSGYATCLQGNSQTGWQMDTTCPAVVNATQMDCYNYGILNLEGIQYFDNLRVLDCSRNAPLLIPSLPSSLRRLFVDGCFYANGLPPTPVPALPAGLKVLYITNNPFVFSLPALPASLDTLVCGRNDLRSLPTLPSGLTYLDCYDNYIFDMPSFPSSLKHLKCGFQLNGGQTQGYNYTTFPPLPAGLISFYSGGGVIPQPQFTSLPAGLKSFWCDYCGLTSLPTLPDSLRSIYLYKNQLATLPALPDSLDGLTAHYCQLTSLPALPPNMKGLNCSNNQLTSLPALPPSFRSLTCSYNQLTTLPAIPPSCNVLHCDSNLLTFLPALPPMYELSCSKNQLTTLPPLTRSFMYSLNVNGNPLTCLPPLPPTIKYFYFYNTPLACLPNYPSVDHSNPALNTLPLCDLLNNPNGCDINWNIGGNTYFDHDSNCTFTGTDAGLNNITVQLWSGGNIVQQMSNAGGNGAYSFNTNFGNYQVRVNTAGLPFNVLCPGNNQLNANVTALDSLHQNLDFALECKPGFDLEARSIVPQQFRPGRPTVVGITASEASQFYGGQCALGLSGSVVINMTGPVTYLNPAPGSLTPTSVLPGMLIYSIADFGAVNPFTAFNFVVKTDTTAQAGQQVCFTLTVLPTAGDRNSSNNLNTACFVVTNSFDPNDKLVSPAGNIDTSQHWLTYTVRFQNTGTASAINIYVDDTLDSNLDETTFQLLAYSHQPIVQLKLNAVRFNFPEINLPDSTSNEPESHGYVQYKVRLKDNLPLGTVISNSAAIYFDLNPPVITNTVQTTIGLKFSGTIVTESGTPVPTVIVNLTGDATQNAVVDAAGLYEFTSPKLGSFAITPTKNNDHYKANGVSTLDIIQIRKHVLGSSPLSSPYKMIAADVNGSNSVTVADINELRKFILGTDTTFSGKLWSFVPHDYVFPNPNNPFPYNEFRSYFDLNANQTNQNFIGVKLGDVSGNWNPSVAKTGAIGEVQFVMSAYQALRDDVITIPVKVKDFKEIAGYQFTIIWNAEVIELLETESRAIPGFYGQFDDKGMLTTSWSDATGGALTLEDDAIAFEMKFRVVGAPGTSTEIKIGSDITASEAYTNGLDLLDIKSLDGKVTVGDKTSSSFNPQASSLQLQVQPNPFSHLTNITFTIPQSEEVQLEIYDVLMKEVKTFSGHYNAGAHNLQWNGENNSGEALPNGSYYVKMVVRKNTVGERVLLVR